MNGDWTMIGVGGNCDGECVYGNYYLFTYFLLLVYI